MKKLRSREQMAEVVGKHSVVELHLSSLARTKLFSSFSHLVVYGKLDGGLDPLPMRQ